MSGAVRTGSAAHSEDCRQTGDTGGMSSAVATVDVIGPDHGANKLLSNEVQFVGRFRATEHAKCSRAVLLDLGSEVLGHTVERLVPGGRTMRTVFANQWGGQPLMRCKSHASPFVASSVFGTSF